MSMTNQELEDFLAVLRSFEWEVVLRNEEDQLELGAEFKARYPNIPEDYLEFLKRVALCANSASNVWFLGEGDYNGYAGHAFAWNEFEIMSLESTQLDENSSDKIRKFWRNHFPFMLSVHSDYAFLALCVSGDNYGAVVAGYAPEFEEAFKVCGSFGEFVKLFSRVLKKEIDHPDLGYFV
jgi:hypothetical protein